ncbi:MAG TPA: hypothetical protein PLV05_07455 [Verrucomicrobiota bacterium]|nr:hypothetical protein [Verrucomicrobiota bacterium]HRR64558.1 hypothetical protein [Candidatus Paceibacterota bacterium]HOM45070.1 hypothetical protein [Verrucomicrobiota bacterium]HPC52925.1 hypothetical protein [Verrucomicrobiota bacterium]HPL35815.1 hypothetical protein [Verrucomicrobiota bacterium]
MIRGFDRRPGAALAGLLALLLLTATAAAGNHSWHHAWHHDGDGHSHFCLICSLAQGQITAAPLASISAIILPGCYWVVSRASVLRVAAFRYRFPHGRAPPCA